MISIFPTNWIHVPGAYLRAWDFNAPTTRIEFRDSNGVSLGFNVRANADGYLTSQNTNTVASIFVDRKCIIEMSEDDINWNVQWVVQGQADVNNGLLLNKNNNQVWSANSQNNYTLNYNDLANTPTPTPAWSETEQVVRVSQWGTAITVNPQATVLRVQPVPTCACSAMNGCNYSKAIQLIFTRAAQQLFVLNEGGGALGIWKVPVNTNPTVAARWLTADATIWGWTGILVVSVSVSANSFTFFHNAMIRDQVALTYQGGWGD